MKNQKGFTPIIIVILIAVLVLLVPVPYYHGRSLCKQGQQNCPQEGWLLGQSLGKTLWNMIFSNTNSEGIQTSSPTPLPSVASDETTNWKTYISTKYGYQIKTPQYVDHDEGQSIYYGNIDLYYNGPGYIDIQIFVISSGFESQEFNDQMKITLKNIKVLENLNEGAVKSYKTSHLHPGGSTLEFSYKKLPPKDIGGNDWFAFEVFNNYENNGENNELYYFITRNGFTYVIDPVSVSKVDLNNILSTFKFTQ